MDKKVRKEKIIARNGLFFTIISVLIILAVVYFSGCSVWGGASPVAKPVAKLETELDFAKKELDQSRKQYENIGGNLTAIENKLSKIETTINTISIQVTKMETTYNETPFWKIYLPIAATYILIQVLKFIFLRKK